MNYVSKLKTCIQANTEKKSIRKETNKKVTLSSQAIIYIFHYRSDKIFMDEITLRKRRLFLLACMFNALVILRRLMSLKEATPTELSWTVERKTIPCPSLNYSGDELSVKLLLKNLIDSLLFVSQTDVFSNNVLLNFNFYCLLVFLPLILNCFQFILCRYPSFVYYIFHLFCYICCTNYM